MFVKDIKEQKNTSLILGVIKENGKIRRGEVYKEVTKKQLQRYGTKTSYQTICRDVDRLLKKKIIKIVEGGKRSQILSLN